MNNCMIKYISYTYTQFIIHRALMTANSRIPRLINNSIIHIHPACGQRSQVRSTYIHSATIIIIVIYKKKSAGMISVKIITVTRLTVFSSQYDIYCIICIIVDTNLLESPPMLAPIPTLLFNTSVTDCWNDLMTEQKARCV